MAYLGTKPANALVNTEQINAGAVTTSDIADANVTQAKLASGVAGNGPAFSASPSTTQSVTSGVYTKITLGTENFDTNDNFASSRFTPTVAGYYFLSGVLYATFSSGAAYVWPVVYKNGTLVIGGTSQGVASSVDGMGTVNGLVYMNGSTDYVELYAYLGGTTPVAQSTYTQFSGFLARAA